MKKLFILFLSFFIISPAMAEYIPVKKEQSEQYRIKIQNSINSQIPKRKKEIIDVFDEAEKEQNFNNKLVIIEKGIDVVIYKFYMDLIDVTEKYAGKNVIYDSLEGTDDLGELDRALKPYFEDNKINTFKINSFFKFARKKQKELEKKFNYRYLKYY